MDRTKLIEQLVLNEGLKLKAYTCTMGKRTIGIGRNFQDVKFSTQECHDLFGVTSISFANANQILSNRGITKEQAYMLVGNDIDKCINQLDDYDFWKAVKDDDERSRALIDLCFNMGINTLLTFKNTLAYMAKKDWPNVAKNLSQSKWFTQVGNRGTRICKMFDAGFGEPVAKETVTVKKSTKKAS